ncbi:programmed cell death protein 6 [Copidosoma floridanum]|uniref:programmed cell death protein 6 n=1 Tax=Copidosoma floridanum TaxID=29053 RepID=UPI0006C9C54B|nr:programmed cell death protein 6 [Copidosoma floridanum]
MSYIPSLPSREFLWDVFQRVDTDRSGEITANELQRALSNGTWEPFNMETVQLMIGMFDTEKKGSISFEKFGALWKYVTEWQQCFRSFDRDNSGSIDQNELKSALISFGYRLSDPMINTLMRKFDRMGRGNIFFDDFIRCCVVLHTLTTAYRIVDGVIKNINYEHFLGMVLSLKV